MEKFTHIFGVGADCGSTDLIRWLDASKRDATYDSPFIHTGVIDLFRFTDFVCSEGQHCLDYGDISIVPAIAQANGNIINSRTGAVYVHDWFTKNWRTLHDVKNEIPWVREVMLNKFSKFHEVMNNSNNNVLFIFTGIGAEIAKLSGIRDAYSRSYYDENEALYFINSVSDKFAAKCNLLYMNMEKDKSKRVNEVKQVDDRTVLVSHNINRYFAVAPWANVIAYTFYKDLSAIYGDTYFRDLHACDDGVFVSCHNPKWSTSSDILWLNKEKTTGYRLENKDKFDVVSWEDVGFSIKWHDYGVETFCLTGVENDPVYVINKNYVY